MSQPAAIMEEGASLNDSAIAMDLSQNSISMDLCENSPIVALSAARAQLEKRPQISCEDEEFPDFSFVSCLFVYLHVIL